MEDIIPEGRLAELLAAGYRITYAEDTATGDGWFADLRDQLGRVTESGGGHTKDAAREHLAERVERDGREAAQARAAAPRGGELEKLLGQAYEVTLTADGADPVEYWAHVRLGGGPMSTAAGATIAEAVWAASPLHDDDEPFPGTACPATFGGVPCTESGAHQFHYGPDEGNGVRRMWEDGDDAIGLEVEDLRERVDVLEDDRDGRERDVRLLIRALCDILAMERAGGFVARLGDGAAPAAAKWYCAGCGGQFAGEEPPSHRCGGCSPA